MVLDLLMPEMDGFEVLEVLEVLKEKNISFPIVVLTADIQGQVRDEVIGLSANELLNKPQVKENLLDTLISILG